jgi:hypothetical protein
MAAAQHPPVLLSSLDDLLALPAYAHLRDIIPLPSPPPPSAEPPLAARAASFAPRPSEPPPHDREAPSGSGERNFENAQLRAFPAPKAQAGFGGAHSGSDPHLPVGAPLRPPNHSLLAQASHNQPHGAHAAHDRVQYGGQPAHGAGPYAGRAPERIEPPPKRVSGIRAAAPCDDDYDEDGDGPPPPPGGTSFITAHDKYSIDAATKRGGGGGGGGECGADGEGESPYKGVDPKMAEMILNEVLDRSPGVRWEDVAGLDFAKQSVMEAVVWPIQRPDLFTGLRQPSKGLLLFGPPGTGKTLIGKAIATESGATFFSISASSLMSKWIGEARARAARRRAPVFVTV